MMKYRKPERLQPGDTVAVVSPSWGGPYEYPYVFDNGLKALRDFGLIIKEYPTARMKNELLWKNPQMRAKEKQKLEARIVEVIAGEFGRTDLPIVANFDVGHTDPQLILPLGVKAEIDCLEKKIALIEAWMK